METPFDDRYFMKKALDQAEIAFKSDEVPVGAIVVVQNQIIGRGHNLTERLNDVTAHAEMQAITAAANYLGAKFLTDCTLYVTLEPCAMCAGALYWSQLSRVVYAAKDPKRGFLLTGPLLHPRTVLEQGPFAEESQELLQRFFKQKR
jgi:tRNA(adenine34) deaminase